MKIRSIMQSDSSYCYLCRLLYGDDFPKPTEEHHAIGGNGKKELSTKYKLTVRLCAKHHTQGKEAVHNNIEMNRIVQKAAQEAFEKGYPGLNFREIFGRNYK